MKDSGSFNGIKDSAFKNYRNDWEGKYGIIKNR